MLVDLIHPTPPEEAQVEKADRRRGSKPRTNMRDIGAFEGRLYIRKTVQPISPPAVVWKNRTRHFARLQDIGFVLAGARLVTISLLPSPRPCDLLPTRRANSVAAMAATCHAFG